MPVTTPRLPIDMRKVQNKPGLMRFAREQQNATLAAKLRARLEADRIKPAAVSVAVKTPA